MRPPSRLAPWLESLGVPVLSANSVFPEHYATHTLTSNAAISDDYLLSSAALGHDSLTSEIDHYLGTTRYVFFSLGKGYLKQDQRSAGLMYDPFLVTKTPGATVVLDDLLHILDRTQLLQTFCLKHQAIALQTLRDHFAEITQFTNRPLHYATLETVFLQALHQHRSLLDLRGGPEQRLAAYGFDLLLRHLPTHLEHELKHLIRRDITTPNTLTTDLDDHIRRLFQTNGPQLHTFSDHLTEEHIPELRVPGHYPLRRGLIAVYHS